MTASGTITPAVSTQFYCNCDALAGVEGRDMEQWAQVFCNDMPARVDELCELVACLRSEIEVMKRAAMSLRAGAVA